MKNHRAHRPSPPLLLHTIRRSHRRLHSRNIAGRGRGGGQGARGEQRGRHAGGSAGGGGGAQQAAACDSQAAARAGAGEGAAGDAEEEGAQGGGGHCLCGDAAASRRSQRKRQGECVDRPGTRRDHSANSPSRACLFLLLSSRDGAPLHRPHQALGPALSQPPRPGTDRAGDRRRWTAPSHSSSSFPGRARRRRRPGHPRPGQEAHSRPSTGHARVDDRPSRRRPNLSFPAVSPSVVVLLLLRTPARSRLRRHRLRHRRALCRRAPGQSR